jgi:selenocysteine-specific elongation factor
MIALFTHRPSLSSDQEVAVSKMLRFFETRRANPPTRKEATAQMGGDMILRYMCRQNLLVELPEGIMFERSHYDSVKNRIVGLLRKNNSITIQELRDHLGLSRKYVFPLLTKLQEEGVVYHQGDRTVLRGSGGKQATEVRAT